jgi:hypothetical protein
LTLMHTLAGRLRRKVPPPGLRAPGYRRL